MNLREGCVSQSRVYLRIYKKRLFQRGMAKQTAADRQERLMDLGQFFYAERASAETDAADLS